MQFSAKTSNPDTVRINGQEFPHSTGIAFSLIGEDTVLYTHRTHLFIFNALKVITPKNIKKTLRDYDVKVCGPLNSEIIEQWTKKKGTLEYQTMGDIRNISFSGRLWKNQILNNVGTYSLISFWSSQADTTTKYFKRIIDCFEIEGPILWAASDSKDFNEFDPNTSKRISKGEAESLKSNIAPHLTHDELLDILRRAHYDVQMSPFEKTVARELQGLFPLTLKNITGGYNTAAEYNYRSRFSENFMPLLNSGSGFDCAVKQYLESLKVTTSNIL